jgi:cytochrome c oxidase assembly protein subunit 15
MPAASPARVPGLSPVAAASGAPAERLAPRADSGHSRIAEASVATWLGVLLLLLLTLNTVGGWVRLSGSGVAIPRWPVIHDGSLLPPTTKAGWQGLLGDWQKHQAVLEARIEAGEIGPASRGRSPTDLDDFRRMFWTEYSHRLLAAVTALVLAGCLTVTMRERSLRRLIGVPLGLAAMLVVTQAGIGAALIDQGTNTHWLFLHQGNAALIVAAVVWALMRILPGESSESPTSSTSPWLRVALPVALFTAWMQLLIGALVAGSRFMPGAPGGALWDSSRTVSWNLLDNSALHQVGHRVWATVLVAALLWAFIAARGARGQRLHLGLQAAATFVAVQILLGLATVIVGRSGSGVGTDVALPLAHQLMGMCVFTSLCLATCDVFQVGRRTDTTAKADVAAPDLLPAGGQ